MNKHLSITLLVAVFAALTGCTKSKTDYCTDGMLNGDETEIDCGGECEACPPAATLTATTDGYPYVASQFYNGQGGTSAIQIYTQGTAGVNVRFSFVGTTTNTALPITDAELSIPGSGSYDFALGDTGHVVLTAIDIQRKIISGTFSFNVSYIGNKKNVTNGIFENVRYQ